MAQLSTISLITRARRRGKKKRDCRVTVWLPKCQGLSVTKVPTKDGVGEQTLTDISNLGNEMCH